MANSVYLNGQIVPEDQATVSVFDAGLLHGASAFTTMLARNGTVFRMDRHLARLLETMQRFGLRTTAEADGLTAAVWQVLAANELADARVRVTLSSGSVRDEQPTEIVTAEALPEYPPEWYTKGIAVSVSSLKQPTADITCGWKTGCYFTRMLARQEAANLEVEEALWFTPENYLAEACFCSVFLVQGGTVRTPPLATPVLPGIVRGAVLELCEACGIPSDDQTPLTVNDMLAADEIFITASCSGLRPVVRVERHPVGNQTPGAITRKLMAEYDALLAAECGG